MDQQRPFDPDSREHSEGSQDTIRLSDQQEEQENSYYLDMQEETEIYKTTMQELKKLSKKPTKKGIIQFIVNQILNSPFKTSIQLDHLQQLPEKFWQKTVPRMLVDIVQNKLPTIPLLFCLKQKRQSVNMTRKEVYLVLCHMFFVTIPDQTHCDISSFQNFYSSKISKRRSNANFQKLKCIINYFQIIQSLSKQELQQVVTIERISHSERQYLKYSKPLLNVTVTNEQIQTFKGELLVDFANRVLGGGVLFEGCVQEQILFVLHPELMIAKLTCLSLGDNQVVMGYNIRQYSEYTGYSDSFKFKQKCKQSKSSTFIAIDAYDFRGHDPQHQYKEVFIYRQIHKAYVGFHHESKQSKQLIGDVIKNKRKVVTGKWGCGVFGGDSQLKFLIQWISCSWASREMIFVNYGQTTESNSRYQKVIKKLIGRKTSQIKKLFNEYYQHRLDMLFQQQQLLKQLKSKQTKADSKDDPPDTKGKSGEKSTKNQAQLPKKDMSLFTYILQMWK